MKSYNQLRIAHVDDDKSDTDILQRLLKKIEYHGQYSHFKRGEELLHSLMNHDSQYPNLIFLDMNLPGKNGKDILRELRENSRTKGIPIIMLSGSNSERDFIESTALGCNGYIIKSCDLEQFKDTCMHLIAAWSFLFEQRFV